MEHFAVFALVAVATFIAIGYGMGRRDTARQTRLSQEYSESDEYFYKTRVGLEGRLRSDHLPDSVRFKQRYIYQTLMRSWFDKLAAEYRYDDKRLRQIRTDWLTYLDSLAEWATSDFLSVEGSDSSKRERYEREAEIEKNRVLEIENAFAVAVGDSAVKELHAVRHMSYDRFSRSGKLAPEGQKWHLVDEKLIPDS